MNRETDLLTARPADDRGLLRQMLRDFYAMRRDLRGHRRDVWHPPTDVYETDQDVVIKMSIPGVRSNQVLVECNGEVITVCGVREGPNPGSVLRYHQMEIRNGYFERRIILHTPFDPHETRWQYEDGFLYVFIPKAAEQVRHVFSVRISF